MVMRLPSESLEQLEEIIFQKALRESLLESNNPSSSSSRDTEGPTRDKADSDQQKRPREPSDDDHGEPARKRGALGESFAVALNHEDAKKILQNVKEQYEPLETLRDKTDLLGNAENDENDGLSRHVRNVILSPNGITTTMEDVFAPDAASILEMATASLQDRSATPYGILSREPLPGILL
ncbi:hypothetical protein CEP54_013561 [Fusarium duplospermum]|uniref:Uncharacterized protein n=1 Tax=Fusarium duplospermum TaxID=1325734 RepID=A0A428P264_9HYPO|nr:hypothetical protein CEP54_013561 [Fusarium duplospermum]